MTVTLFTEMSFSPQPKLEAHISDHIEMADLSGMVPLTCSLTAWEADMGEPQFKASLGYIYTEKQGGEPREVK